MTDPRPLTPRAKTALMRQVLAVAREEGYAVVDIEITERGGVRMKGKAETVASGDAADAWLAANGAR